MNKYGYKEIRKLHWHDLRNLCISKNWYMLGNNEEYEQLESLTNKDNITTDNIVEIATDIYSHSNTEYEITNICFEIARICNAYFEEV
jgi:hypothetical protein